MRGSVVYQYKTSFSRMEQSYQLTKDKIKGLDIDESTIKLRISKIIQTKHNFFFTASKKGDEKLILFQWVTIAPNLPPTVTPLIQNILPKFLRIYQHKNVFGFAALSQGGTGLIKLTTSCWLKDSLVTTKQFSNNIDTDYSINIADLKPFHFKLSLIYLETLKLKYIGIVLKDHYIMYTTKPSQKSTWIKKVIDLKTLFKNSNVTPAHKLLPADLATIYKSMTFELGQRRLDTPPKNYVVMNFMFTAETGPSTQTGFKLALFQPGVAINTFKSIFNNGRKGTVLVYFKSGIQFSLPRNKFENIFKIFSMIRIPPQGETQDLLTNQWSNGVVGQLISTGVVSNYEMLSSGQTIEFSKINEKEKKVTIPAQRKMSDLFRWQSGNTNIEAFGIEKVVEEENQPMQFVNGALVMFLEHKDYGPVMITSAFLKAEPDLIKNKFEKKETDKFKICGGTDCQLCALNYSPIQTEHIGTESKPFQGCLICRRTRRVKFQLDFKLGS